MFLFCGKWRPDEQIDIEGLKIDANFAGWPGEGHYFDAGFGPVNPIRVLFDGSNGRLQQLLQATKDAYEKGPLMLQPDECTYHVRSLNRNIAKIKKHEAEPEVQFYYKSKFYEFFIKVWFERQNKWVPSPAQGLKIMSTDAPEAFALLRKFVPSSGANATEIARQLASQVLA